MGDTGGVIMEPPDFVDDSGGDVCRVCRTEATSDRPLFHPCLCTGSIKYIHQQCLVQWLKYSKKEYCELCNHRYVFQPVYDPSMPVRLPWTEILSGLAVAAVSAFRMWMLYTLVAAAWLIVVPLTAYRIYRAIFTGSIVSLLTLPLDLFSTKNVFGDVIHGGIIIAIFLCSFICLVWLREQIIHGGPAELLNLDVANGVRNDGQNGAALAENVAEQPAVNPNPVDQNQPAAVDMDNNNLPNAVDGDGDADDEREEEGGAQIGQEQGNADANQGEQANQEDNNWLDWAERPAEELGWERLLGFDGSLVFLEHIFWVISLNTFFTLVFAFSPYHVGNVIAGAAGIRPYLTAMRFSGPMVWDCPQGYVAIAASIFVLHLLAKVCRLKAAHRATGMSYLVLKVFLLVLCEAGIFPTLCGWWLDICSLSLFSATLSQRFASASSAPATSMFVHWLMGMFFVFYFASFVLVLRDELRPGVLWFLRNLNDPEFNPIQEMLTLPVARHCRRIVSSLCLFAVTILLTFYVPLRLVARLCPSVLPYDMTATSSETPMSELSFELVLLQIVLPALLEQSQARTALRALIRQWCLAIGAVLGVTDYLLGDKENRLRRQQAAEQQQQHDEQQGGGPGGAAQDVLPPLPAPVPIPPLAEQQHNVHQPPEPGGAPPDPPGAAAAGPGVGVAAAVPPGVPNLGQNVAAGHQALLHAAEPTVHEGYKRPRYLPVRIIALLLCLAASVVVCSVLCFTVPVTVGRRLIYWGTGERKAHELYTVSAGLYACYLALRGAMLLCRWLNTGWRPILDRMRTGAVLVFRCVVACVGTVVLLPLLMGTAFSLVLLTPARVAHNQTPICFYWQDWALGIFVFKIVCAAAMLGPDWWLKAALERLYRDGARQLDLGFLYLQLVLPLAAGLVGFIAAPYVAAHSIAPVMGVSLVDCASLQRAAYPFVLFAGALALFLVWQVKLIGTQVARIRDERYLVGQRLVNYDRGGSN